MKSEHRHDLKTNELAEWLTNLPQWAKDNTRTLIYIGVVIILVAAAYIWKVYNKNVVDMGLKSDFTNTLSQEAASKQEVIASQASGQDSSFVLTQIGNKLQQIADTSKNNNIASLALIKSAEAIRAELHYRQLLAITPEETVTQLDKAEVAYKAALQKADNPTLTAMAKYGIGLCEEELGNFDTAKKMYREIVNDPNLQPTVAAAQAKFRLEFMDEYKEKIEFKPAPPKESQARPTIELQPGQLDMNQVRLDANAIKPAETNAPVVIESNDANKAPEQ